MPLDDGERRRLTEIERALTGESPRLARRLARMGRRRERRRVQRQRARSAPPPEVAVVDPVTVTAQLRRLLGILEQAVDLQPGAAEVIVACAMPGEPTAAVARRGGALTAAYWRLVADIRDISFVPQVAELGGRVRRLLDYHLILLHEALQLAFNPRPSEVSERVRRQMEGLGPPGEALREARDETSRRLLWI